MTKTTKKADAYNITKDALTKAFNITFNGVYSSEVKTFMFNQHFRWSKTNKCFYGWTKDIQSLSNKIRELVFNWRNAEIKTNFIECPLIMADDIQTVHVYQNKCDYIAACKKQPEAVVEKITIDELLNDDDPAIVQTVANVITKEKEASLDAKKDEKIEKVTNSQELEATLDEYWKRWIYIGSKLIESYEDIVNASNEIARVMLRELDFSEFKHSAYSEPESPTLEELTNYALYHTYNPETAAEHVTVTKLNNPEYIRGVNFCGTKCASIEEAMEDIEEYNKDFDPQQHVMQVQAYIDFDNEIEYQKFIHLGLMKDQSWLIGENHFGGSCFVNLETLEGIEDVNKTYYMPKEERIAKALAA